MHYSVFSSTVVADATVSAQAQVTATPEPSSFLLPGDIVFGKLAELWKRDYVEKLAAGRPMIAATTKAKYPYCVGIILPRWKHVRLRDIRSKEVLD